MTIIAYNRLDALDAHLERASTHTPLRVLRDHIRSERGGYEAGLESQ